ncbi:hypothetical protein HPP92_006580 [Vanilla planifolia]|uniref:Uncharacterized protein n=1 Tax=Vanilla planifolia TaxID=51239 RepID=A0A835RPH5_VANPL|nr:hypothetical protein HPP92_006580 [Vanilla planifolia]
MDAFQGTMWPTYLDLAGESNEVLSLIWIRKPRHLFMCIVEFRGILFSSKTIVFRPPLDRLISEFFDRGIKALDICNAIRDGIEQIRHWKKHLEIVLARPRPSCRTWARDSSAV